MLTLYSKGCEYVIRALVCAGQSKAGSFFRIRRISRRAKVPEAYTRKMFQKLVRTGFLKVRRGPGGGYQFRRPFASISLLDVIRAVDGKNALEHCIMGLPQCGEHNPCPIHKTWRPLKCKILKELESKTLAQLNNPRYLKNRYFKLSGRT
jgi:Rrf2 family transcriptional regulator, iron-sulfur cluster assembly transcription factor